MDCSAEKSEAILIVEIDGSPIVQHEILDDLRLVDFDGSAQLLRYRLRHSLVLGIVHLGLIATFHYLADRVYEVLQRQVLRLWQVLQFHLALQQIVELVGLRLLVHSLDVRLELLASIWIEEIDWLVR